MSTSDEAIGPDPTPTPEHIWLLLHEGEEGSHVWCDDPDPTGHGEHDAVEYIRADVVKRMLERDAEARAIIHEAAELIRTRGSRERPNAD